MFLFVTGGAWIMMTLFIVGSFIVAFGNYGSKKKNRALQTSLLTRLKNFESIALGSLSTRNGKTYYEPFRWIYSTNPNIIEAGYEVEDKISLLATQPESSWFPK